MKVGILGCGFSGRAIARKFINETIEVWGTTRRGEGFGMLADIGVSPVLFDGQHVEPPLLDAMRDVTHLVVSIAPPREENTEDPDAIVDPVLASFQDHDLSAVAPKLTWICYLSTVGVYGNHDGAWIDETINVAPNSARSRQRVRAEAEWSQTVEALDLPLCIFRLSGIYGAGRNALLSAHNGKSRRLVKKNQVFNRIHVGDIASATRLAAETRAPGIFNITDHEPAPPQDVVTFAHGLLGTTPPDEIDFESADLSPMARSFYGENKRVSNAKSLADLGMVYKWPNYRVALNRMYDEDDWRDIT